jgi:hypothetical protein
VLPTAVFPGIASESLQFLNNQTRLHGAVAADNWQEMRARAKL